VLLCCHWCHRQCSLQAGRDTQANAHGRVQHVVRFYQQLLMFRVSAAAQIRGTSTQQSELSSRSTGERATSRQQTQQMNQTTHGPSTVDAMTSGASEPGDNPCDNITTLVRAVTAKQAQLLHTAMRTRHCKQFSRQIFQIACSVQKMSQQRWLFHKQPSGLQGGPPGAPGGSSLRLVHHDTSTMKTTDSQVREHIADDTTPPKSLENH
jgi:hypothetical protein